MCRGFVLASGSEGLHIYILASNAFIKIFESIIDA